MKIIAERVFTPADQNRFAMFSGDANPLHVDELEARRTVFGAPVVHGLHLVFWALENWVGADRPPAALIRLIARFSRGVLVGNRIQAAIVNDGDEFGLSIRRDGEEMSSIGGRLGPLVSYPEMLPAPFPANCRVNDYAQASRARGSLPLSYYTATAPDLFPRLSARLPSFQLAALLATTRLVGMECPGRQSLYSAMEMTFDQTPSGPAAMNYRVDQTVPGASMIRLAVDGPGFRGRLRAFVRPAPYRQASASQLAGLVAQGEFAGQRALVVGGSRGLGEVAAKLLASGGAETTITYRRGREDAEAVANDIIAAGGRCQAIEFDVTGPGLGVMSAPPTHVYYFATPHISSDDPVAFSPRLFADYCRYYVTGFVETLLSAGADAKDLRVFYPSTVFLDDPAHMAEYCAAKAAGEETCRQLAVRFPNWRIHVVRLPRLLTDQNNGFQRARPEAPENVILKHLREMK